MLHYGCDSTLTLVILVDYVIFTEHPSSLFFFFMLAGYLHKTILSPCPFPPFSLRLSKSFPQGQSLASSEAATSNVAPSDVPI